MPIRTISQDEFRNYNFQSFPTGSSVERYWFADDEVNIIGTIALDNFDNDWGFVLLALESDGEYRVADIEVSIEDEDEAIRTLTSRMADVAKADKIEKEIYTSNLFDEKSSIIVTDIDDEIKKYFNKHPEKLYEMNPRKFEELIASILKDLGFDIELTQATRDGGRDIIASIRNAVTNMLAYVECKRYAADFKVGVGIIRQVSGVHYLRKPTKSIIVTTGFFTKDAVEEARLIENQLDLKDFNDIREWLKDY
ncbi:MAG: restriction endonuclease [Taibaiella sp.]|nr:restriction endonuclease [Taibaiella sp.]